MTDRIRTHRPGESLPKSVDAWRLQAPMRSRGGLIVSRLVLRSGGSVELIEFIGEAKSAAHFDSDAAAERALYTGTLTLKPVRERVSRRKPYDVQRTGAALGDLPSITFVDG